MYFCINSKLIWSCTKYTVKLSLTFSTGQCVIEMPTRWAGSQTQNQNSICLQKYTYISLLKPIFFTKYTTTLTLNSHTSHIDYVSNM